LTAKQRQCFRGRDAHPTREEKDFAMTHAPTDHAAAPGLAAPPEEYSLQFRRTVDRGMVHRAAVSEVFVTDVQTITNRRALVAVQLPQSHAYYNDHVQEKPFVDALLVLESCRQAAISGAHAATGIPVGTSMLVDMFSIQLTDPAAFVPGSGPLELAIETVYSGVVDRSGRVRRGRVEQNLLLGGVPAGVHEMDMMFVRSSQHDALRRAQRGSPAPSTADYRPGNPALLVPAIQVGRVHPHNVVLSAAVVADGQVAAVVTPHPDNRGLFDHVYDHLPAMTLTEAARQLALLSLDGGTGAGAGRVQVVGLRSRFTRFAELDAPLLVRAPVQPAGPLSGRTDVTSVFEQNGASVAEATVTLIPSDRVEQP
jgi:hypothetical protein